jgi:hypothetical protein
MRTTISLPDPLLVNAKHIAAERGMTLSALVEVAVRNLILSPNPTSPAPPFRLQPVRGRLVYPDQDLDRTSALVVAEDEAAFRSHRR